MLVWRLIKSDGVTVLDGINSDARHLVVTQRDGSELRVELFERADQGLGLRVSTIEGTMLVEPEASNTVKLINDTYYARHKRRLRGNRG